MIQLLNHRGVPGADIVVPRAAFEVGAAVAEVAPIVADVAAEGPTAALRWGERLDGVRPPALRVPEEVLVASLAELDDSVGAALAEAIERVRRVHGDQHPRSVTTTVVPGASVTQRFVPVDRVGLYVPGGRAVYPSSVIMNVVPAQEAGVASIAVVSPPQRENGGWPNPTVLATCQLLGVSEVYSVGGAQAVALLAHGGGSGSTAVRPVRMITGPGNVWVTAAKRLVMGSVGIDSEAGPTEIMIIADDSADAACVAGDLISQAEHDPLAAAVLVTDSESLAEAVVGELARQVPATKHTERIAEALSGVQSAIVIVAGIDDAIAVANNYGAEHLEIHTHNAQEIADRITNAGAIFLGSHTPVSLGDYAAGSNHVLPTGGSAAFSSGLGVHTFLRPVQVVSYDDAALADIADTVRTLAEAEDLPAHATAITARIPLAHD
ncbi:MAG: histidinol dehydrogenase [Candidatus Nanopelagicales bacterium]